MLLALDQPVEKLASDADEVLRQRVYVRGQVQGVGFRPFIYRVARRHLLRGWVRNVSDGVIIEVQGPRSRLARFLENVRRDPPALADIREMTVDEIAIEADESEFRIAQSASTGDHPRITVDTATCADCLRELRTPTDRRFGYALINCTNCGPRYSIIHRSPYDRTNTTMAGFSLCPRCEAEYVEPADRRFHAEPTACSVCGPRLELVDPRGEQLTGDPVQEAVTLLNEGRILAVKGIGGFHLAVRADDHEAVRALRQRKQRDAKPFALMVESIDAADALVTLGDAARDVLRSCVKPIVLAPRRAGADLAPEVAPGNHRLGVMVPYTPVHALLFGCERPRLAGQRVLVMTSGNTSDEPLTYRDEEVVERLGALCDAILWHNRPIARSVDDSVVIDMGSTTVLPIRRARGYVPAELRVPNASPTPGVCVGGELKNTVAVVREDTVVLSQHLGDLKHPSAFTHFKRTIDDLQQLFELVPQWIACDRHPLYLSTTYAKQLASRHSVPLIEVQHHHAHAAAVLAEHGESGPALALIFDGVGFGDDGTIWGGELLRADLSGYERLARQRPLRLPGGDAAARDTRRCALALLHDAFPGTFAQLPMTAALYPDVDERRMLCTMLERDINCVASSALGRVFDGVAALVGLCRRNRFEAEAPIALEAAAHEVPVLRSGVDAPARLFAIHRNTIDEVALTPLVQTLLARVAGGASACELSALFHEQIAQAWAEVTMRSAARTGLSTVVLSGGVFCNQLLTERLRTLLAARGLRVLRHQHVPPNDGGIAFGQAAVAAAQLAGRTQPCV